MSKMLTALGLMSGTSLDGIDVALLRTDGELAVERGPSQTFAYDEWQQGLLRRAIVDAKGLSARIERPGVLEEAEAALTYWHIEAVKSFSEQRGVSLTDVDLIGFHGQTVIHRPGDQLTVQLGGGEAMAKFLGIDVVYDMRAADVAAGGQGAPLVSAYHRALAKTWPSVFVNIGGVANVTYVGADGELLAFDTGPGNALLNDWMMKHRGVGHDEGGAVALSGTVSSRHAEQALAHPFFAQRPPKSLDRNSFAHLDFSGLSFEDGAATLARFTVEAIAAGKRWFPGQPKLWIISGGGRHNQAIMQGLRERLQNVVSAEDLHLDGDAMEAEAWAYLAVRSLKGLPLTYPGTTGVGQALSGGVKAAAR